MFNIPGFKKFYDAEKGGAASAETFENTPTASTDDVTAVLHFDPFKKGEEIPEGDKKTPSAKNAKEEKPEGGDEEGKSNLPSTKGGKKASTSTKPSTEAKPGDKADYWRGIAEERERQLNAKAPKKEDEKEDAGMKIPEYNFTIPDELVTKLTSDKVEDFKQGIGMLAKGLAGAIHAQMAGYFQEAYNPRFDTIPSMMMQAIEAHAKAKAISDDFYGNYPEYNHPQLKPIVKQLGNDLAKKLNKSEWDEELRDAIAEQMALMLGGATKKAEPKPPVKMLPSGGARTMSNKGDEVAQDIADTLFSQF